MVIPVACNPPMILVSPVIFDPALTTKPSVTVRNPLTLPPPRTVNPATAVVVPIPTFLPTVFIPVEFKFQ